MEKPCKTMFSFAYRRLRSISLLPLQLLLTRQQSRASTTSTTGSSPTCGSSPARCLLDNLLRFFLLQSSFAQYFADVCIVTKYISIFHQQTFVLKHSSTLVSREKETWCSSETLRFGSVRPRICKSRQSTQQRKERKPLARASGYGARAVGCGSRWFMLFGLELDRRSKQAQTSTAFREIVRKWLHFNSDCHFNLLISSIHI